MSFDKKTQYMVIHQDASIDDVKKLKDSSFYINVFFMFWSQFCLQFKWRQFKDS